MESCKGLAEDERKDSVLLVLRIILTVYTAISRHLREKRNGIKYMRLKLALVAFLLKIYFIKGIPKFWYGVMKLSLKL